jgi:hypothetical protein
MLGKILAVIALVSVTLLVVLLNVTTPSQVGPFGVLAFFVLVYLVFLGVFTAAIVSVTALLARLTKSLVMAKPTHKMSTRKAYYLSTIVALAPVMILAAQSFGGIGFLEMGLIILFEALGCFLVIKR